MTRTASNPAASPRVKNSGILAGRVDLFVAARALQMARGNIAAHGMQFDGGLVGCVCAPPVKDGRPGVRLHAAVRQPEYQPGIGHTRARLRPALADKRPRSARPACRRRPGR